MRIGQNEMMNKRNHSCNSINSNIVRNKAAEVQRGNKVLSKRTFTFSCPLSPYSHCPSPSPNLSLTPPLLPYAPLPLLHMQLRCRSNKVLIKGILVLSSIDL